MALFNLIELFRLLCLSQKMDLKNFVTAKFQRKVVEFFFFFSPFPACFRLLLVLNEVFFARRDTLLVSL